MFFWFYIYEKPVTKKLIVFEQRDIHIAVIGLLKGKENIWI